MTVPKRLNIGSDVFKIPGLINIDIRPTIKPQLCSDILNLPLKDDIASEINLGNIIEHLDQGNIPRALSECRRVLQAKGVLYITIPLVDLAQKSLDRGEIDKVWFDRIVKGEESGYNSHKTEFRMGDIERVLEENGFDPLPLQLNHFPYLVVSDTRNPKPDPWQYGVIGQKRVLQ